MKVEEYIWSKVFPHENEIDYDCFYDWASENSSQAFDLALEYCNLKPIKTNSEITAKEYLKTVGKDDRIVNRDDLPEFWVYISDLMEGYAQEKTKKMD